MLMDRGFTRVLVAQPAPCGDVSGLVGAVCQGDRSDNAAAQGNWVLPSPPLAGKDLAGCTEGEGEPSLLPLTAPPEVRRELITVYVCTVIPHEPLCLWNSHADC